MSKIKTDMKINEMLININFTWRISMDIIFNV